jgi:hypothetical protein
MIVVQVCHSSQTIAWPAQCRCGHFARARFARCPVDRGFVAGIDQRDSGAKNEFGGLPVWEAADVHLRCDGIVARA